MKTITKTIPTKPLSPPNLVTLSEDGKNDFFEIRSLPEGSRIEIRDRWGKLLFQDEEYLNNWRPESEGTYFYQIRFKDGGSCQSWLQAVR